MDFKETEKKIFFDVISDLTGHYAKTGTIELGLTKRHIIKRVGEKITVKRAIELFEEFTAANHKYLDDEKEDTYRLSSAGRVLYFDHLKNEAEKADLDRKSVDSTIKTGIYTRRNIIIGIILGSVTVLFVILNFTIGLMREIRESQKENRELFQQVEELKRNQQPIKNNTQTNLHFSDTSLPTSEVKIEK